MFGVNNIVKTSRTIGARNGEVFRFIVYEDKIYIWNDGEMPPNLDTTAKLFMKHSSKPYNPKLANIFFKSGMIEACDKYLGLLSAKEKVIDIQILRV